VGAWQESVESNRASAAVGDQANKLHAQDYMVYGHLQLGQDAEARKVLDEVRAIPVINMQHPLVRASGYAIAAIPARYVLERGQWAEAAALTLPASEFDWGKWPQAEGLIVFARGLGAARSNRVATATQDVERLTALHTALTAMKQGYWAGEIDVQRQTVQAWIARAEGRTDEALQLMRAAADAEDKTEKSIVSPGRLVPARELLGEMLLELNRPAEALAAFEASQHREPNRFRGYLGAARAAKAAGDAAKARMNYEKLVELATASERPEVREARAAIGR
jgi:tetratricopeptide (TPR) repeat protein